LDRFNMLLQEFAAGADRPIAFGTQTGERRHLLN